MKHAVWGWMLAGLFAVGVADEKPKGGTGGGGSPAAKGTAAEGDLGSAEVPVASKEGGKPETSDETATATPDEAATTTEAATPGEMTLTPENTRIVFIGTHAGAKPDPRIGGFQRFTGKAVFDPPAKTLKSISVDIDATSIWTKFPPLTAHLKNADFFDVNEIPKASFQSTSIEAVDGAAGQFQINGDLTLHGVTKPISFPASVTIDDSTFTLKSDFKIDRTQFDMNFSTDKVEKDVSLSIVVGEKTDPDSTNLPAE